MHGSQGRGTFQRSPPKDSGCAPGREGNSTRQQGCRSASTLVRKVECGWSVGCWGHFFLGMGQRPDHAGLECHAKGFRPDATARTSVGFKAGAHLSSSCTLCSPSSSPEAPLLEEVSRNHRAPPAGADGKGSKTGVRSGWDTEGSNHRSVSVAWWGNHA